MDLVIGSAEIAEDTFLAAFERCELPLSCFRHGDHLRLAWILLRSNPVEDALRQVRDDIQRYAAHHGISHIYHETITEAWVRLLATHRERSFEDLIAGHRERLSGNLLHRFWTPELLASDEARRRWVAPDRMALPE